MAKLWIVCDSLVVSFLLFLWISAVYTHKSYYQYDIDPGSRNVLESFLSLELNGHSISKRQTNDSPEKSSVTDNRSNPQPALNSSSIAPTKTPKKYSNIDNKQPLLTRGGDSRTQWKAAQKQSIDKTPESNLTLLPVVSSSVPPLKDLLEKRFGENGTGIRKDISSTEKPILSTTQGISLSPTPTPSANVTKNNQTRDEIVDESGLPIPIDNTTLIHHNINETRNDSHIYYNSTFIIDEDVGRRYWIDMSNRSDVVINDLLSKSHRRAATIKLKFDFPFYGQEVRNVTIATGGFLYTGDYVHSWLAATQYIAPLMANFDTSLSNDSYIKYVDNGTAFTVQWEKVALQDKPGDGEFTFQTTLLSNGDIIFVYQNVPLVIENIQDDHHPVKVGLSDAYIIDRTIFFVRRKTIYEYHRVNFNKEDIRNWTVIYLTASPTCLNNKDCHTCLTKEIPNFQCTWCPSTSRCSNGLDRHRQDWLMNGCDKKQVTNESQCSQINTSSINGYEHNNEDEYRYHHDPQILPPIHRSVTDPVHAAATQSYLDSSRSPQERPVRMGVSGIVATLFIIALVACLGIWVLYAYRNPHTTSGQILIRYRPSQWRWKRGEARYTAATIHM